MNARVKSDFEIVFVGKSSKAIILKESCDDVSRVLFAFGGVLSLSLSSFYSLSEESAKRNANVSKREERTC